MQMHMPLFRVAMRVIPTLRGAEGLRGQESPLPLLGQGSGLRPGRPRSLLTTQLAVQGTWTLRPPCMLPPHQLRPQAHCCLPCEGPPLGTGPGREGGAGGEAGRPLPGCSEVLHVLGPCLSPNRSAQRTQEDPGGRPSPSAGSKGEGGGLGEEQSPPDWRPGVCLLTIPCLAGVGPSGGRGQMVWVLFFFK